MLSLVSAALAFNVGSPMQMVGPTSARASAPLMIDSLERPFVYDKPKGGLSANFAANMGDCAQIEVAAGYKRRIVPAEPTGYRSEFLASRSPMGEEIGKVVTVGEFPGAYSSATSGMVMPTAVAEEAASEELAPEEAVSA